MPAVWMLTNAKNGMSSWELHRALGVTQKTAWFMLHRIRLALQDDPSMKIGGSGNPVEVDETFIGGKARNMHRDKRARLSPQMQGGKGKAIVIGMLERGGKVKATVIPKRWKENMQGFVRDGVEKGATVMTDEASMYLAVER